MEKKQYTQLNSKYLSNTLSYFGFQYMQFTDSETGKILYSFEDTKEFRMAMKGIQTLKNKINNRNK